MRMLVICLTLGSLVWLTPSQASPNLLTVVGFMAVTGLTVTRVFRRAGVPGLLGALIAGFVLSQTQIISAETLHESDLLYAFSLVWAGFYMSSGITPRILSNPRLVKASLCIYLIPLFFILFFMLFHGFSTSVAIPVALLAGSSTLLFLPSNSKMRGEIVPLGQMVTLMSFSFWMIFSLNPASVFASHSVLEISIDGLLLLVLLEATVQVSKVARTQTGQQMALLVLAYLLALASYERGFSPMCIGFPAGVYLSLRRENRSQMHALAVSDTILSFAMTSFVLHVSLTSAAILTYSQGTTLGFYFAVLLASKTIAGLIAQHFFLLSPKSWLPIIPHGLLAFLFLPIPPTTLFSSNGSMHSAVLASLVLLAFAYPVCSRSLSIIKKDPLASHRPTRRVL
ncbi:MAG: hypothetical protein O3B73_08525 [bacterium]|nr:hypothetical protein [bacterium]